MMRYCIGEEMKASGKSGKITDIIFGGGVGDPFPEGGIIFSKPDEVDILFVSGDDEEIFTKISYADYVKRSKNCDHPTVGVDAYGVEYENNGLPCRIVKTWIAAVEQKEDGTISWCGYSPNGFMIFQKSLQTVFLSWQECQKFIEKKYSFLHFYKIPRVTSEDIFMQLQKGFAKQAAS